MLLIELLHDGPPMQAFLRENNLPYGLSSPVGHPISKW